jgi:hypothetical protein
VTRLAELQRAVQSHVLADGELPATLAAAVHSPAHERWQIYTDGYRLRLVEALTISYPALAARLGPERFAARMLEFIAVTPSVHRSIRNYGGELGAFIRARAQDLEDELQAELASFEWQLAAAFDARDVVAATAADLASVVPADWAGLVFGPVPSLRRIATTTNAVAAWRATQATAGVDGGAGAAAVPAPAAERTPTTEWLIVRPQLATLFRSLSTDEAAALGRLLAGGSFGELCATLLESHGERAALTAASWLKGWLHEGLLLRRGALP